MSILDRYAGVVIDLDGVVLRDEEVFKGAAGLLRRLCRAKKPFVLVTNNATRRPEDWVEILGGAKVKITADQVLTSAQAAGRLLAGTGATCFVVGSRGLTAALADAGLGVVDDSEAADAVVVGLDRQLTYDKLRRAAAAIQRGARFVGTNPDATLPTLAGDEPGNGAALAYLRTATGVAPEVVGKPHTAMFELAAERLAVDGPICVIGDRIETDVVAADRMGWDACLVLTGVSGWPSLIGASASPRWVVPDLAAVDGPEPPEIRHAREADLSTIHGLLETAGFHTDGAAARLRTTLVAEDPKGRVVATAAWEPLENAAHLRAITVAPDERGHGTASHIVVRALDELQRQDVEWVYLLTPGADELFERLGFWRVTRDRVPATVLETAQFAKGEQGASALVRRLRD